MLTSMRARGIVVVLALAGSSCARFGSQEAPKTADGGSQADAGAGTVAVAACDPAAPFEAATPLLGLPDVYAFGPRLSADELTMYFHSRVAPAVDDIYVAKRSKQDEAFGQPIPVVALNSSFHDGNAMLSLDGTRVVFASNRPGGTRGYDLYDARRSGNGALSDVRLLPAVSADGSDEFEPFLSPDGRELWFARGLPNPDVFRAFVVGDAFDAAEPVSALNSGSPEWMPVISADGSVVYFGSERSGTEAIWQARRNDAVLSDVTPVAELASAQPRTPGWLSPDNCRLYFSQGWDDVARLWIAQRRP